MLAPPGQKADTKAQNQRSTDGAEVFFQNIIFLSLTLTIATHFDSKLPVHKNTGKPDGEISAGKISCC